MILSDTDLRNLVCTILIQIHKNLVISTIYSTNHRLPIYPFFKGWKLGSRGEVSVKDDGQREHRKISIGLFGFILIYTKINILTGESTFTSMGITRKMERDECSSIKSCTQV